MGELEKADLGQEAMSQRSPGLTEIESDTIGEILNISMGAAATAISTLLGRQVRITTPVVSTTQADALQLENLEPSVGIEIKYIEGHRLQLYGDETQGHQCHRFAADRRRSRQ